MCQSFLIPPPHPPVSYSMDIHSGNPGLLQAERERHTWGSKQEHFFELLVPKAPKKQRSENLIFEHPESLERKLQVQCLTFRPVCTREDSFMIFSCWSAFITSLWRSCFYQSHNFKTPRATSWTDGFLFPAGARDFSLFHNVQTGSGAHPASYPVGTRGPLSPGVKRLGREAGHSPPSSDEIEIVYLHSPIRPHGVVLN
jgi:hypothetical protein